MRRLDTLVHTYQQAIWQRLAIHYRIGFFHEYNVDIMHIDVHERDTLRDCGS